MRVLIFGAGGLGCFFGARLLEAGASVHFLARGSQFHSLKNEGLRIRHLSEDKAYTNLSVVSPDDDWPDNNDSLSASSP